MKTFGIELEEYWDYQKLPGNHPFVKTASSHCFNNGQGRMYLFGGFGPDFTVSNKLYEIDPENSGVYNTIDPGIEGRTNHDMYFWKDTIIIAGGISYDYPNPLRVFQEIILISLPGYEVRTIRLDFIGMRFTSFFDYSAGCLYYTGGFETDNAVYKVDIASGKIQRIDIDGSYFSRGGAASLSFGDKAILFSGFRKENGIPHCYSDYYIYSFADGTMEHSLCSEFAGRTFSKPLLLRKYHKILFMLGTYNGMEQSHSGVCYDYEKNMFDGLCMQDIPVSAAEPVVYYLERTDRIYISGGITNNTVQDILWKLDTGAIPNIM